MCKVTVEQRRSQRIPSRLLVDVAEGHQRFSAHTENVSRHGIFLATQAELRERFLVQLSMHLPDGPLTATGFVARTAAAGEATAGVGIQFFALSASAKARWDAYVHAASGLTPAPTFEHEHPERATFLVKLKDRARLEEFATRNFDKGGLYMATPVIKPEGALVALVVVHPESEAEYVIEGDVARVCREPPKGMDVRFDLPDEAERARFRRFVQTGHTPRDPVKRGPPTPDLPIPAPSITGDFALDIEVDESALEESARFSWEDISDYRMVLDFELTSRETADIDPSGSANPLEVTLELERPRGLSSDGGVTLERPAPPELVARAKPTGDFPAPPPPPEGAEPGSTGDTVLPGPALPHASPSRRNAWTWPTPPAGITPLGPTPVPVAPPRFPPPRAATPPAAPAHRPPEVLDLGLADSREMQIPILDPILEPDGVEDVPILPPEEAVTVPPPPTPYPMPSLPGPPPRMEVPPDVARGAPEPRAEVSAPAAPELEASAAGAADLPSAPEVDWAALVDDPVGARWVAVRCVGCDASFGALELGPVEGPVGLVAEVKPYWNPDMQRLVGVSRLRRSDERAVTMRRLAQEGLQVPLEALFAVAELNRPPADPETGARVRVNALVKSMLRVQDALTPGARLDLPSARCPRCKDVRLVAEVSPSPPDAPEGAS